MVSAPFSSVADPIHPSPYAQEIWLAAGDQNLADAVPLHGTVGQGSPYVIPIVNLATGSGQSFQGGVTWDSGQRTTGVSPQDGTTRLISFPIFLQADSADLVAVNVQRLWRYIEIARRFVQDGQGPGACLWLRLLGVSRIVWIDVVDGDLPTQDIGFPASDHRYAARVTLECLPFARGQAVTYTTTATLVNGAALVSVPGVPGDVPALARLTVVDQSTGGKVLQRLRLGGRSLPALGPGEWQAVYLALSVAPGTGVTDATALGGFTARLAAGAQSATAWQPFASFTGGPNALGLGAGGKNSGEFDVWAHVRDFTAAPDAPGNLAVNVRPAQGYLPSGLYTYLLFGRDGAGNLSPASDTVSVQVENRLPSGEGASGVNILDYEDFEQPGWLRWEAPPAVTPAGAACSVVIDALHPYAGSEAAHLSATGTGVFGLSAPAATTATIARALPPLPASKVMSVQFRVRPHARPGTQGVLNPTVAPTLAAAFNGGGQFTNGNTYTVCYTWVTDLGSPPYTHETPASPQTSITLGGAGPYELDVTVPTLPVGVTHVNIYVSDAAGSAMLRLDVSGTGTTTPVLALPAGTQPVPPASNTTATETALRWFLGPTGPSSMGVFWNAATQQYQFAIGGNAAAAGLTGSPFTLSLDTYHAIEIVYDASEAETLTRLYVDGALVAGYLGGTVPTRLTFTAYAPGSAYAIQSDEYYVGNIIVADAYMGTAGVMAGAANVLDWDAGLNAAGYLLYWQVDSGNWYSLDVGLVTTYTHQLPIPNNPPGNPAAGVVLARPPVTPPALAPAQLRSRLGVATTAVAPVLLTERTVTPALANGIWEWLYLGTFRLPPLEAPEGMALPPWYLLLEGRPGSSLAANLDCDGVALFPHDEDQLVAEVIGDSLTALRTWQLDCNRLLRQSGALLSELDGSYQGQVVCTGRFRLGRGDNLVSILADVGGTLGGKAVPVADVVNGRFTVQIRAVPRYRWIAGGL